MSSEEKQMDIETRQSRIQQEIQQKEIDFACLFKPHNVFYLAGWAPVCAGVIIFPDFEPVFCTLWLDAPEGNQVCAISNVEVYVFPRESLMGKTIEIIKKRKPFPKRIGIEKDFMLVQEYEKVLAEFPDAEFINITPTMDQLRAIKSKDEIDKIQMSAAISDKAMEAALEAVEPYVTELDIAAEAEYVMKKLGSEKPAFSTFVASGERTVLAHPVATRRKIQPGDVVVIDLGATWEGYVSDICRTTFAVEPTSEQVTYLGLVIRAQQMAAAAIHEGAVSGTIYDAAYQVFQEKNLGRLLPDRIGFGVGLRQSEFFPIIEKGNQTALKENMVVAILQTTGLSKRIGGLRVEDTFRVTRTGCMKLTKHIQPPYK